MIRIHAPLECKAALLAADIQTEKQGREICDKIMFELHMPKQCIDEGLTSPDECAEFMDNFRGPMEGDMMDRGPSFGPDCGRIEDPMERLDCYDNKGSEMGDYYGPMNGGMPEGEITWQCKENRIHWPPDCETFMREEWPEQERMKMEEGDKRREQEGDWRVKEQECAASCDLVNGWWDFRGGECVCYATEGTGPKPGDSGQGPGCGDCSSECPANAYTDCVDNRCVCGEVPDMSKKPDDPDYDPATSTGGDSGSDSGELASVSPHISRRNRE